MKSINLLFRMAITISLVIGALVVSPATPAFADTLPVTNTNDSGAGSLRQAIADAVDGDTIDASGISGTITLASELSINKNISIIGPGWGVLTISGNNAVRVFIINSGKSVSISGLTISNGHVVNQHGAGINNLGDLTLDDVHVTNNVVEGTTTPSFLRGGGIHSYDESSLTVTNSTISGNTAVQNGGGIHIGFDGAVSLENVVIDDNYLSDSNSSGGGITIRSGTTATLNNVTISNNSTIYSGGGLYSDASLTLTNSLIANNFTTTHDFGGAGGGLLLSGSGQTFSLTNVTISGNLAENVNDNAIGGGILLSSQAILNLNNVTIAGNTSDGAGGGIYAHNLTTVNVRNTIIGNNTASTATSDDCAGTLNSLGYNLIQSVIGCDIDGDTTGNITNAIPNLGPLTDNGGPTQTMALLAGSPAIDAGDDDTCAETDQRGVTRPQGSHCDIGAYEVIPPFADVDVNVGGLLKGNYEIDPKTDLRISYAALNDGPVQVIAGDGKDLVSSIRVLYKGKSYSEMLGYPVAELTDEYWFPIYDSATLNSQIRVGNMGAQSTTISIYIGNGQLLDSFTLEVDEAIRKNYSGTNDGPLRIVSSNTNILASVRYLQGDSYSEELGYPGNQLTTEYWFPWYNNNAFPSQLRVANTGNATANVTVYIGDDQVLDSFSLNVGESIRKSYAGVNNGPVRVVTSDSTILPSIRVLYKGVSYSEMLGLPTAKLTNEYWFPVYDSSTVGSQVRVGNVGDQSTTISVYVGDGQLLESFTLGVGEALRKNYAGTDEGPLHVVSSTSNVLVSVRILKVSSGFDSYYELLAYPGNNLMDEIWFPWYNNNAFPSQLRIAVP